MILHYDHIAKRFPEQFGDMGEVVRSSSLLDLGLDGVVRHLVDLGVLQAHAITTALMAYHNQQGQQTFEVGPVLAELLEHTDLGDMVADQLRLPYGTFYVSLPNCHLRVWGGTRTQWHRLDGFYVHCDGACLALYLWGSENERSIGYGDDASRWAILDITLAGTLERNIEDLLQVSNKESAPLSFPMDWSHIDGLVGDRYEEQMATLRAVFRIAINLSLYLVSSGADVREAPDAGVDKLRSKIAKSKGTKRKRFEAALSRRTIIRRVGHAIETSLREQREQHGPVKGTWVRGHWRTYWTGHGRKTAEKRWILPHPRGVIQPDARTYNVPDGDSFQRGDVG